MNAADMQATIDDQEKALVAADRLAKEHAELLDLVESRVGDLRAMDATIAAFQVILAQQGKHQLIILKELRTGLTYAADSLESAL